MQIITAVVAMVALAVAKPLPQGVTASISPAGPHPSGCSVNHSGYFGLAVQTIGSQRKTKLKPVIDARAVVVPQQQPISTIDDGQVQAPTDTGNGAHPIGSNTANSGTPTGNHTPSNGNPTGSNSSNDGSPSASNISNGGNPSSSNTASGGHPTASTITSSGSGGGSDSASDGTSTSWVTVTTTISITCSSSNVSMTCSAFTFKSQDTWSMWKPSTMKLSSGGVSRTTYKWSLTATNTWMNETLTPARSSILTASYSIQNSKLTNTTMQTPLITTTTMIPVSQISDGQVQATETQTPATTTTLDPVTTIPDGQIQATNTARAAQGLFADMVKRAVGFWQLEDLNVEATTKPVGCRKNNTLEIQLHHGVLTDHSGRIGYIASNFQFQFDAPPQAGALYTAGFSLCENGKLALGNSTTFYRCLSGDFYNLYDRYLASQCEAIELLLVNLEDC